VNSAALHTTAPLGDDQLKRLLQRLREHVGIKIDSPPQIIEEQLRTRMSALGIEDIGEYQDLLDDSVGSKAEWLALVDLLTVKETRFFRQRDAFECAADYLRKLVSEGPTPRRIAFWSAGCATGQELYSLAMVVEHILADCQPWLKWQGIGTDISFGAINAAEAGRYGERAIAAVPALFKERYLLAVGQEEWDISPQLKARTRFFHSNLLYADSAPRSDFNIIFCQNVLIYFERERQRWIIDQLVDRLATGGLLVLGAGEDASWSSASVRRIPWPGVCAYSKIGG